MCYYMKMLNFIVRFGMRETLPLCFAQTSLHLFQPNHLVHFNLRSVGKH